MRISFEDLDVEILESTPESEDQFSGRRGWFWHECHMEARGPFGSPPEAVADLSHWIDERYSDARAEATVTPNEVSFLARTFLTTAQEFLKSAEASVGHAGAGELVLAGSCYALELVLKSYLLSRGRGDAWNERHIRDDLVRAKSEAVFFGLPGDDARIDRFLKVASEPYAQHELFELARRRPNLLAEVDYLMAIRVLLQQVDERLDQSSTR